MPERKALLDLATRIPEGELHTATLFLQYLCNGDRASAATLLRIVLPTLNPYSDEDRLSVQLAIAEALGGSDSKVQAVDAILQRVGEAMGWAAGSYFALAGDALVAEQIWTAPGRLGDAYREITAASRFAVGEGLPGQVYATGKAVWIADLSEAVNFPRKALRVSAGLQSGLAFPIVEAGEVTGLIEFFTPHRREVDEGFLAMLELAGIQIGMLFQRFDSQQALRHSEQKFRSLCDTAVDAIVVANEHGTVTSWNQAAERMFGFTREEMVGNDMRGIIPDRHWGPHQAGMRNANEGQYRIVGNGVKIEARRSDGREITVQLTLGTFVTERGRFYCAIIRSDDLPAWAP